MAYQAVCIRKKYSRITMDLKDDITCLFSMISAESPILLYSESEWWSER